MHLNKDNIGTPVMSNQPNAQASSLSQHIGQRTGTFEEDGNEIQSGIRLGDCVKLRKYHRSVDTKGWTLDFQNASSVCYNELPRSMFINI